MAEDRLRRDYDTVENLSDLIAAREERKSALSDDLDAMEDFDSSKLPVDANVELTWPHPKTRSDEEGAEGLNVKLMGEPDQNEVEFDWQDSVEEMLPTDPNPDEGMEELQTDEIHNFGHVNPANLADSEELGEDGSGPVPIETAMDTDSDQLDFTIEERFAGQVSPETAEYDFGLMERSPYEPEPRRDTEQTKDPESRAHGSSP